jgi:gliding motility-associated lipoprotein GldD
VHAEKADGIAERVFTNDQKNVYALLYEIEGNTASNLQFVATDSTRHFLRGALYFNSEPNFDSIQPVLVFFQKDIARLIESLEWTAE